MFRRTRAIHPIQSSKQDAARKKLFYGNARIDNTQYEVVFPDHRELRDSSPAEFPVRARLHCSVPEFATRP